MSLATFKAALKGGQHPTTKIQKATYARPEAVPDAARTLRFVASTSALDRDGDTIAVDGWDTSDFERNPVILWGHDQSALPIGRCIRLVNDGDRLVCDVEFVKADTAVVGPMADAVYTLCVDGFLGAVSVGFVPMVSELSDDPARPHMSVDFKHQSLLEISIVTVPSNPEALLIPGPDPVIDPESEERAAPETVEKTQVGNERAKRQRRFRAIEASRILT